jgi:hypothetical protein
MKPGNDILTAASPNGTNILIGDMSRSELFLEDARTHERRFVFGVTVQTMSVLWSPNSLKVIAKDRPASSWEDAYLYDVRTLRHLDLRQLILSADRRGAHLASDPNTSHAYVHGL